KNQMLNNLIFNLFERFSFIRKYKIYEFIKDIGFPFIINLISKLFREDIDDNLIVLGAYAGRSYFDNAKYLFEFFKKKSKYKVIWITKNNDIISDLKKKRYNVLPFYSIKTIKLLRKAKFIFLSHGYLDIIPIKFSSNTKVILTWHGTPIKKINLNLKNTYAYSKWNRIFKLNLEFNEYVNYLLTPTKEKEEHLILTKAFKIPLDKILSLGYPRNDILFVKNEEFIKSIKNKFKIPNYIKKIILYAPTFRDDFVFRFPLTDSEMESLNEFLTKTNTIFLIKAHMFEEKIDLKKHEFIKLVKKDVDIQELLLISDILITDYSSMIFDYLLLDRPILLFAYDLKDYVNERGMYYDFKEIAPGPILFNGKELIDAIKKVENIDKKFKEKRELIRNRFNKYINGKSSERILKFLNINFNYE
ncbi:MAG: CDP-glycerol glycerophosphotransferase family protein, partial [Candidatus Hodarchaeota archaeon]